MGADENQIMQKLQIMVMLNRLDAKMDLLQQRLNDLKAAQEEIKSTKDKLIWRLIVLLGSLAVSAMGLGSLSTILTGGMP